MKVWSPVCPVIARTAFQSKPAFITIDVAISRVECASSIGARLPNVWYATAIPTLSQWESLWEDRADHGVLVPVGHQHLLVNKRTALLDVKR